MKKALTPKQRLFVHEYLVDLNATQAAIRAGYSKKTADTQGPRLLGNVGVRKAIEAARERRENKAIMTREEILEELSLIGRFDLADYFEIDEGGEIRPKPFDRMPPGASRALKAIKETRTIRESADGKDTNIVVDRIEFEGQPKVESLKLLGQNQGLFPNKVEGSLTLTGKLSIEDMRKSAKEVEDAAPGD